MHWFAENWFNVVQTVALIATIAVAGSALRSSGRATRGSNSLAIATNNRQIWGQLITIPELQSVLRPRMNADEKVSYEERRFVLQVIHHAGTSFELARMGEINRPQGMRRDAHDTFSLPVFRAVWDAVRIYQDPDFGEFLDSCLRGVDLDKAVTQRRAPLW